MKSRASVLIFTPFLALCAPAQKATAPATKSGDFVIKDFQFRSGEMLPEPRMLSEAEGHLVGVIPARFFAISMFHLEHGFRPPVV